MFSAVLGTSGYHVLVANDAEEALRRSRDYTGTIHLLLTDVRMPGMSGLDLAATLIRERPSMRIMMMSGSTMMDMSALKVECYAIQKPFSPSHLRATIAHLLAGEPGPPAASRREKA